jgi:hypothetical protein
VGLAMSSGQLPVGSCSMMRWWRRVKCFWRCRVASPRSPRREASLRTCDGAHLRRWMLQPTMSLTLAAITHYLFGAPVVSLNSSPRFLVHDRDSCYGATFDRRVRNIGLAQISHSDRLEPTPSPSAGCDRSGRSAWTTCSSSMSAIW